MAVPLLFGFYCVEAGLFFLIAPWTRFWAMNPILHYTAAIGLIADNHFVRGFVSGLGIVHLIVGVRAIVGLLPGRADPEDGD